MARNQRRVVSASRRGLIAYHAHFQLDPSTRLHLSLGVMRSGSLLGLAFGSCIYVFSLQAAADTDTQVHLGLEASIYSNSSITGSSKVDTVSGQTEVKSEQTVSEFGLPGSANLSLGVLLNDQFDLGMRFGYSSHKTGTGSSGATTEISGFEADPYLAFVTGTHRDSARVALGILGGLGSASVKFTTPSSGSSASTSSDSSADSKSYGAFLKLYGMVGDSASIDPAFTVMSTHASSSGIDLSGVTYMLSVGVSIWPGRTVTSAEDRPKHRRSVEGSVASNANSTDNESAATPQVTTKPKPGIVVLKFGSERTITFLHDAKSTEPDVIVLVRDPAQQDALSTCNQLTFHAENLPEDAVEAASGTASSQAMRFPVLRASVSVETLRKMVSAPIANNASIPQHWIDVCTQRWKITEQERSHLKEFVRSLPPSGPAGATAPATPESTHVDEEPRVAPQP